MSDRETKKYEIIFTLTAIFSVALPVLLILSFNEDIINAFITLGTEDDSIYWVVGIFVIPALFGLLSAYMIYNKVKNNITSRSKILAIFFLPILLFGTIFAVIYYSGTFIPEKRGPYLSWTNDPRTTMTITFELKTKGNYKLSYGESKSSMDSEISFERSELRSYDDHYHYTVTVTGLKPDTRYYYGIPDLAKGPIPFNTAPNKQSASYKFLLYGDSKEYNRIYNNQHIPLINQIKRKIDFTELAFVVHTGDTADDHDKSKLWNFHFYAIKELAQSVPYFVASGNHEWNDKDPQNLDDQPALDIQEFPTEDIPAANIYSLNEASYSFGYANAFFVFLGYGHVGFNDAEYLNWLEQQLAIGNSSYDFTFVAFHRSPFDDRSGDSIDDNVDIIKSECPLFHNYSVEAVFSGHNHVIAHQKIKWDDDPNNRYVHYIISGGGGANLRKPEYGTWDNEYGMGFRGETVYCKKTYHFFIVEIDGEKSTAKFTAYNLAGLELESFTLDAYN